MAFADRYAIDSQLERAEAYAGKNRLLYFERPILVHGRAGEGPRQQCSCCGSPESRIIQEIPHIDVVIDRLAGTRSVLQRLTHPTDVSKWHEKAKLATKIYAPARCTVQQLPVLLDTQHKAIFAFGGNQTGKTTLGGEFLTDRIFARRGLYLWVAPTQEKTQVGVDKLCRDTEFARAILPKELVRYFPKDEEAKKQEIELIDGTTIELRYASKQGGNIKGLTGVLAAVVDEGAEITHEINYTITVNRLLLSRGQVFVPSTPVEGNWLQSYDARTLSYNDEGSDEQENVKLELSPFDNVWVHPDEVQRTINSLGGEEDPRVQREVFGRWTGTGVRLWRCFEEPRSVVDWKDRDVTRHGFFAITDAVGAVLFGESMAEHFPWIVGGDFNKYPFSAVLVKVIVPAGADRFDPKTWHLYAEDTVVKRAGSAREFGEFFANEAGALNGRGLEAKAYQGSHGVYDGTGFGANTRDQKINSTTHAIEMAEAGHVVRPPYWRTTKGRKVPANPPRKVRHAAVHELHRTGRALANGRLARPLITAWKTEQDDGTGDTKKASNTAADRKSGPSDGFGYIAWTIDHYAKEIVAYMRQQEAEREEAARDLPRIPRAQQRAGGW